MFNRVNIKRKKNNNQKIDVEKFNCIYLLCKPCATEII